MALYDKKSRREAMIAHGIKPFNDSWRPSAKLKKEMEEREFYMDFDLMDGFYKACIYAPNGYKFSSSDAHCDCAIEFSDKAVRKAMDDIEECHCEECEEYRKGRDWK